MLGLDEDPNVNLLVASNQISEMLKETLDVGKDHLPLEHFCLEKPWLKRCIASKAASLVFEQALVVWTLKTYRQRREFFRRHFILGRTHIHTHSGFD